jgi:hypothetical protein
LLDVKWLKFMNNLKNIFKWNFYKI